MTDNEALLREVIAGQAQILASQAKLEAKVEALDNRVDETRQDAREARDVAKALSATLAETDIAEQLAAIRAEIKALEKEWRADLSNSYDRLKKQFVDADAKLGERLERAEGRISALERRRDRHDGAVGLAGWLMRHAPWIFAVGTSFLAALGWKDRLL